MRIISGHYKGRKIIAPKNLPVRPTTDFAKEALFNILRNQVNLEQLNVLDLFAGTGNMSFEFISRGVLSCLAVEQNKSCIQFIQKTAQSLEMKNLSCFKMDVFKYLSRKPNAFDLIFADPPYALEKLDSLPNLILNKGWLSQGGILILEHGREYQFEEHDDFKFTKQYGNVNFTLFEQSI